MIKIKILKYEINYNDDLAVFKIYDVITLVRPTLNVKKNAILKCFWRAFLVIS